MAFAHVGIYWYAQSEQDLYSRLNGKDWPRDVVKKAFNIMMKAPRRSSAIFALNEQQRKTRVPVRQWDVVIHGLGV